MRTTTTFLLLSLAATALPAQGTRPRARDIGIAPGIFAPGPHNAITDVDGVRVGHATLVRGDSVRTGITAILPHAGNLYKDRVPAAIHVGNGFGKLIGSTQVRELGELETPILLTCTLCVWRAADAMVSWLLEAPDMQQVRSINAVVGETNDGGLNAIRERAVAEADVRAALTSAAGGSVAEGSVGAGTGTVAFGWKGGIGTSSRALPASLGGWTLGVLVQSNFGGVLQVMGAPVGQRLGQYSFRSAVAPPAAGSPPPDERGDGSIMIVVATDAPLSARNLERLASRAMLGLGRTGSAASNGSGDYVIAFSTGEAVRRRWDARRHAVEDLANEETSALFQAVVEATEEAIYNSLLRATTVTGNGRTVHAIPIDSLLQVMREPRLPRQ